MPPIKWPLLVGGWVAVLPGLGCSRPAVPDPKAVAIEYAQAAEAGDAARIYALMTEQSQREYGPEQTRQLVRDARRELQQAGSALKKSPLTVEAQAEIRFSDGERAVLELERGRFWISKAGTLPSGAVTPAQALAELRTALARRSYPALMRVMTSGTRGTMENNLRALVSGLEDPETLQIEVEGDQAEVELPDGHKVKLKREEGLWKIDDLQ